MLLDNLSDLFQRGLEYAWDCEHMLLKHLPKMVEAASMQELKQAVDLHLVETKGHIYRLEQIFTRLDRSPAAEKNEPIRIIVEECEKMIGHLDRSALLDAALVFHGIKSSNMRSACMNRCWDLRERWGWTTWRL